MKRPTKIMYNYIVNNNFYYKFIMSAPSEVFGPTVKARPPRSDSEKGKADAIIIRQPNNRPR